MVGSFVSLHYHFVWATLGRAPWLIPRRMSAVERVVRAKCAELGVVPLALGGVEDHLHLLIGAPASLSPSSIIGPIKGASSHVMNSTEVDGPSMRWQGGYGVFSVSMSEVPRVRAYVLNQEAHHADGSVDDDLERVHAPRPR